MEGLISHDLPNFTNKYFYTVFISGVANFNGGVHFNSNIASNGVFVSPTTCSYLVSATSNLQPQLNTKANTTTVHSQLALKVGYITVHSQLAVKADVKHVDAAIGPCLNSDGCGYTITLPSESSSNTFFYDPRFTDCVLNIRNNMSLWSDVSVGATSVKSTQVSHLSGSTSNLQNRSNSKADITGASFTAPVTLVGTNFIEFGKDTAKQGNARCLAHQRYSTGLDVIGAGLSVGSRLVKLWDNVTVGGSASFGSALVSGNAVFVTTDTQD